jgi:hypothetical protein
MPDLTAKRTLVKSPPELWEELSEVDRLARHLDAFGEIRITKLEPEHTVAWEGEHASGTVSIEPSGWGTKVTLTAELPEAEPPPVEEPPVEQPPVEVPPMEEPEVEEPSAEEPRYEEPSAEAPQYEEPSPEEPPPPEAAAVDPPLAQTAFLPDPAPRRRRGFWAWLFRERTEKTVPKLVVPAAPERPPVLLVEPVEPEPAEPESVEVTEPQPVEPDAVEATEPEPVEPEPVEPALIAPEPPEPEPAPDDGGLAADDARAALDGMLDALGSAHHRPYSRG